VTIQYGGAPLNIANGVREFAVARARHEAVVDGDRRLSFAELGERSNRVATALLDAGLTAGDRVALVLGNRLEYPEMAAGIAKAGLIMVPVNPRLTGNEIGYILDHSEVRALVLDDAYASTVGPLAAERELAAVWSIDGEQVGTPYEQALRDARDVDPQAPASEHDTFVVAYTSGTTGRPKGVQISHRSRCLTFMATALEWGIGPGRRTVAVAPMYHGAGFAFAYAAVFCGATLVMLRRWDPEGALDLLAAERANSVFLVPTHGQMIRSLGDDAVAKRDLSALEHLYFNAAALPHPLKLWVLDAFPGARLTEVYGSTEAAVVTCLRHEDQLRKPGSVGPAWFHTEVSLRDPHGQPVAPGELGELFSRSPYLMNGYLKDDAATAACTTSDGFLTAGDLARVDDEGFVSIVDRVKDMIVTGGINVYPREVEDLLVTHQAIEQVAVTGVDDEQWGETVAALVVRRRGQDLDEAGVLEYCREHLAGFKVPRVIRFAEALPASPTGKILKREVRHLIETDHHPEPSA
jgi:acyl-CoA synthetase (AMP-forming)/AMP-acid ligase II